MTGSPGTCTRAADFLAQPDGQDLGAALDHIQQCQPCQKYFNTREVDFAKVIQRDPLGALGDLAVDANRRLAEDSGLRSSPTRATREIWAAPVIEGFRLGEKIGETGNSQVFVASQVSLNRQVALKIVRDKGEKNRLQELVREASLMAALKSPNILTVHETGTWEKGFWIALEYCPQGSVADAVAAGGPWNEIEAAALVRKVALAAHSAHQVGIIHRDIKPSNILIGPGYEPKLADFGLARSFSSPGKGDSKTRSLGSPAYTSPEQASSRPVDARTDVHGLGTVLYHLLTGHAPFRAGNNFESLMLAAHTLPLNPGLVNSKLSRDLCNVCMKCLAKDPSQRYLTAEELAKDLDRFLSGKPVKARPLSQPEKAWRWVRRNKGLSLAIAGSVSMLLVSTVMFALLSGWALRQRSLAETNARLAVEQQHLAELRAYASAVQRANHEWNNQYASFAADLLAECPFELRGWEHDYITTKTRQCQVELTGHLDEVTGIAMSPEGRWVASTGEDGQVILWDSHTGSHEILTQLGSQGIKIRFSADGERLVATCADGTLRVWKKKQRVWLNPIETGATIRSEYSRRGAPLATTSDCSRALTMTTQNRLALWDTESGARVALFDAEHASPIGALEIAPDGRRAASADRSGKILLWDMATGKQVLACAGHPLPVLCLAFSTDGKQLFSGGMDNSIRIWDTSTGQLTRTITGHTDWVNALAISPDGSTLASGSDDNLIRLWDVATGNPSGIYTGHTDFVNCLCFSPEGRRLFSGGYDQTVRIWDIRTLQGPSRLVHPDIVTCLRLSPNERWLATGCGDKAIRIWDNTTGRVAHTLTGHTRRLESLCFHPGGGQLASSAEDGGVWLWKTGDWTRERVLDAPKVPARTVLYSPGGDLIACSLVDGTLCILDSQTGNLIRQWAAHRGAAIGLAFSPDGQWLASTGNDSMVKVWKTADGTLANDLQGHSGTVHGVAFDAEGRELATGGDDRTICLWDWREGVLKQRLHGHKSGITGLAYLDGNARLASTGFDNTLNLWDPRSGMTMLSLRSHRGGIRALHFSQASRILATGSDDRSVILRKVPFELETVVLNEDMTPVEEFWRKASGASAGPRPPKGQGFQLSDRAAGGGQPGGSTAPFLNWMVEHQNGQYRVINRNLLARRQAEDRRRLRQWAGLAETESAP